MQDILPEIAFLLEKLSPDSISFSRVKAAPGQKSLWDEESVSRESTAHDNKRPGEFAPKSKPRTPAGQMLLVDSGVGDQPVPKRAPVESAMPPEVTGPVQPQPMKGQRELFSGHNVAPTDHEDEFGKFRKYGNAVDPSGNWLRMKGMHPDSKIALMHATSLDAARSIIANGYNADRGYTDSSPDHVYLGGDDGLGTYIGQKGGRHPVLMVVESRVSDVEPDNGSDWKSHVRMYGRDLKKHHPDADLKSPPAWLTYAAINQVRVPKELAVPVGYLDSEGNPSRHPSSWKFVPAGSGHNAEAPLQFVPHPSAAMYPRQFTTVHADAAKLDQEWAKEPTSYLPPNSPGNSEVEGRRDQFRQFLASGKPIQQPHVVANDQGKLAFNDGRHRTRVLIDAGHKTIPLSVPKSDAEKIRRLVGADQAEQFSRSLMDIEPIEFAVAAPPRRNIDRKRTSEEIEEDAQVTGKKKRIPTDRHEPESGWTKVGGSTVHVDDEGTIDKGCPGLKGEAVEDLIDESDESRERREARQAYARAAGITGNDITAEQAKKLGSEEHVESYKQAKEVAKADPRPTVGTSDVLRGFDDQTGEPVGGNGDEVWDSRNRPAPAESNETFQGTGLPAPMKFYHSEDPAEDRPAWMGPKLSEMVPIPPRPKFLRDRDPVDHDAAANLQPQIDDLEEKIGMWRDARDIVAKSKDMKALKDMGLSDEEYEQMKQPGFVDGQIKDLQGPLEKLKRQLSDYKMRTSLNHNPATQDVWTPAHEAARTAASKYGLPIDDIVHQMPSAYMYAAENMLRHEQLKKAARKKTKLDAGRIKEIEDSYRDHSTVPRFDEASREFAAENPGANLDPYAHDTPEKVWDLIREGATRIPSQDSEAVAELAAQMIAPSYHKRANREFEEHRDDEGDASFNPDEFSRVDEIDEIESTEKLAKEMGLSPDDLLAAIAGIRDGARATIRSANGRVLGYAVRNGSRIQVRDEKSKMIGTITKAGEKSTFRDNHGHMGGSVGEFSRKPAPGQGSFDWDESEHPRDESGKFTDKLHHQIKQYLSDGTSRHLREIHAHTGHEGHDALDPQSNPANKALKQLRDSGSISSSEPEYGEPQFYMTGDQIEAHQQSQSPEEKKVNVGPAGLTVQEAIEKAAPENKGKLTSNQACAATYLFTGTTARDWNAVQINGMVEVDKGSGDSALLPEFSMPAGYKTAPLVWEGSPGNECCGLCGHTIKTIYHIQNDDKKWTMPVGSECVTKFGEGESGERLAKKSVWAINRDMLRQAWDAREKIGKAFGNFDDRLPLNGHDIRDEHAIVENILKGMGYKFGDKYRDEDHRSAREQAREIFGVWKSLNKMLFNSSGAPVAPEKKSVSAFKFVGSGYNTKKIVDTRNYIPATDAVISSWVKKHSASLRDLLEKVDQLTGSGPVAESEFSRLIDIEPVEFGRHKPASGQATLDFDEPEPPKTKEKSRDSAGRIINPVTGQVQARKGGEVSEVDGEWYNGGEWMPIHGLTKKAEPKPKAMATPNDEGEFNERAKPKYTTARTLSPEDLEAARQKKADQSKWDEIKSGPLGKVKWLGDSPNQKGMHWLTSMNQWHDYADAAGPAEIKRITGELETLWHRRVESAVNRENERGGNLPSDTAEWWNSAPQLAAQEDLNMHPRTNGTHERRVPGSAYARQLVHHLLDGEGFARHGRRSIDNMHDIHKVMNGTYESEFSRLLEIVPEEFSRHEFSSTQFNLSDAGYSRSQGNPVIKLMKLIHSIPTDELHEGDHETPDSLHATIKYGVHTEDADAIRNIVRGFGPVKIKLGKVSIFPADEKKSFDVLKVTVLGDDIHRLNALIRSSTECTDTYPKFKPHITLALLNPGEGAKYVGNSDVEGMELTFDTLQFSDKDRKKTPISLMDDTDEFSRALEICVQEFGRYKPGEGQREFEFDDRPDQIDTPDGEIPVSSSNVHSYRWTGPENTGSLLVRFKAKDGGPGPLYRVNAPHQLYDDLAKTANEGKSVGKWYWRSVRIPKTVSGHQYPVSLVGTGPTGYVPRQAGLRRGFTGEHFNKRTLNGVESQLAPAPVKKGPAKPISGYNPNKLTLPAENKPAAEQTQPEQPKPVESPAETPIPKSPPNQSTPKPPSLLDKLKNFFKRKSDSKKNEPPKQFSREEWEAVGIILDSQACRSRDTQIQLSL